jgi:hypothetical protein
LILTLTARLEAAMKRIDELQARIDELRAEPDIGQFQLTAVVLVGPVIGNIGSQLTAAQRFSWVRRYAPALLDAVTFPLCPPGTGSAPDSDRSLADSSIGMSVAGCRPRCRSAISSGRCSNSSPPLANGMASLGQAFRDLPPDSRRDMPDRCAPNYAIGRGDIRWLL